MSNRKRCTILHGWQIQELSSAKMYANFKEFKREKWVQFAQRDDNGVNVVEIASKWAKSWGMHRRLSCNGEMLILYNFVIHKKQRKERDYLVQSVMGKRGCYKTGDRMYRRRPRRRGETLHPVEVTLALPQTKMLSKAFITADFQAPDAIRATAGTPPVHP